MSCFRTTFQQPLDGERHDPFTISELQCLKHRVAALIHRLTDIVVVCGSRWIVHHNGTNYVMLLVLTTNQVVPPKMVDTIQTFILTQTSHSCLHLCRDQWYPVDEILDNAVSYEDPVEGLLCHFKTAGAFQALYS